MPPKRKAQTATKAGGKKAKKGDNDGQSTLKDAIDNLKKADAGRKKTHKPDASCPLGHGAQVCGILYLENYPTSHRFYIYCFLY